MPRLLSPVDSMFLRLETTRAPLHIGCLAIFELPEGATKESGDEFVRQVHDGFAELSWVPFPYDSVAVDHGPADLLSSWHKVTPDPTYHVRLDALPSPGSEAQLGQLIERLHSQPLDLTKPLWEAHIISGLEGNRFAFYFKAHHGAVDGLGGMRTLRQWLTTDPSGAVPDRAAASLPVARADRSAIRLGRAIVGQALATGEMLSKVVEMTVGANSAVTHGLRTPRTIFNSKVTRNRRLAIQSLELARLKAVATATGTTVNDVVLTTLAGSVRRYLLEQDALPRSTLTASVPVGIDRDEETINAAAGFVCPLGTDKADPLERLRGIHAVTSRGKAELVELSPTALQQFTLVGLAPIGLFQRTGMRTVLPPLYNFVVSNLVLSKDPLYLAGAKLVNLVPISFLSDGYALNVTLVGYGDRVTLGFVGCRDRLPHLQRLATYTAEALDELEAAVRS